MVRSLEEIQADKKRLAEEEKEALKAHKKDENSSEYERKV